jgi:hypothetical protein
MTLGAILAIQEHRVRYQLARYYAKPLPETPETAIAYGGDETFHGTVYGYDKKKCHCAACREAKRVYWQKRRARLRVPKGHPHSLWGYLQHRCRCEICVQAYREAGYGRRKREREAKQAMASAQMTLRLQEATHGA